jgi:hypothetical protein
MRIQVTPPRLFEQGNAPEAVLNTQRQVLDLKWLKVILLFDLQKQMNYNMYIKEVFRPITRSLKKSHLRMMFIMKY